MTKYLSKTARENMSEKKGIGETCKTVLSSINAPLLTLTAAIIIVGLVFKFGTSLIEGHMKTIFEEFVKSLEISREEDFRLEDYDLSSIVRGMSLVFIAFGLSSSVVAILGVLSAKIDMFPVSVTYCVLLGLVMVTEIGLVLIITVKRGMIDDSIKPVLIVDLRESYNGFNGTDSLTQTWNILMITMECCGVDDYTDFSSASTWNRRLFQEGWWFELTTPVLCCKLGVKVPGDYSCAVNPSPAYSNYQNGCYDAVWTTVIKHRTYIILAISIIAIVQLFLFIAGIARARAVFRLVKNKTKGSDDNVQSKPSNGKSVNDLIFSTAGMFSNGGRPNMQPGFSPMADPSMPANNWFDPSNIQGNRQRPSMCFIPHPGQSALNHLLQQYYMRGRFTNPADLFNPLNIFTAPFPNSFPNSRDGMFSTNETVPYSNIRLDDRFGDIEDFMQSFNGPRMGYPQIQARSPELTRLMSRCSISALPELENGSPASLRRECEPGTRLGERSCDQNNVRRSSNDFEELTTHSGSSR